MSVTRIAERYATALLNTANEVGKAQEVDRDLRMILDTYKSHFDLRAILRSPVVSPFHKKRIVEELWSESIDPLTMDFLKLVIRKGREGFMPEIVQAFDTRLDTQQKLVRVGVTSAVELNDSEKKNVLDAVTKKTGKEAMGTFFVDPSVLGGITLRIGDTVMDGTLKRQLEQLRSDMATKSDRSIGSTERSMSSL
ncbi:MAG: ATP synthase F1 subunit delta [bacterium]|nr:ATP synthase F1 subunit delta [bacterium]